MDEPHLFKGADKHVVMSISDSLIVNLEAVFTWA